MNGIKILFYKLLLQLAVVFPSFIFLIRHGVIVSKINYY